MAIFWEMCGQRYFGLATLTLLAEKPVTSEDICRDNFSGDKGLRRGWKACSQVYEKINVRNNSTVLLKFIGIQYQSAFHKQFKVTIIAESVLSL